MFKTHTNYEAHCGGTACRNTVLDANLSRYFSEDVTAWFSTPAEAFQAAWDANWAVADGKLLCRDCAPASADADTDEPVAKRMLTSVTTWTFHCDTCGGAYVDGESGTDAVLWERTLHEHTLEVLADCGWTVVETTPFQPEATLFGPRAKRTWEAVCGTCNAETAFRDRLAAATA